MYRELITNPLSFTKIISGISKSLNIVNQVIPLYKEVKPIISNASGILSVFKEMNKEENARINKEPETIKNESIKKEEINNTLTFFQ